VYVAGLSLLECSPLPSRAGPGVARSLGQLSQALLQEGLQEYAATLDKEERPRGREEPRAKRKILAPCPGPPPPPLPIQTL
jgi:hypothetical protein